MKTKIPEELKADIPQTAWGKILSVTPVIMTVVATLLAGLASSEMTKAQYDRALGAQLQSKAGDQWSYFQAKKMRAAIQRNSVDLVQATTDLLTSDLPVLPKVPVPPALNLTQGVKGALDGLDKQVPENEMTDLLKDVSDASLSAALQAAKENARVFDGETTKSGQQVDEAEKSLPVGDRTAARRFAAARMQYNAARYELEARVNQAIASIYELQVRRSNMSSERHHRRSTNFFFGMLAAQAAVIISTLAVAARQRSLLWTVAAVAGIAAIIFAIYVYLRF